MTVPVQFATLFGGLLATAGVLVAVLGLRHVWRASRIVRAPATGTAGADEALLVRYDGTVTGTGADGSIEAPFSGTDSVVVRSVVEERQLNPGLPPFLWDVTIDEDSASAPFELRTPAGAVTVDGAIGTAILESVPVATVRAGDEPPARVAQFQSAAGLDPAPLAFGSLPGPLAAVGRWIGLGRRTYSEQRLAVGDDATVVGRPFGDDTVDPLVVSDRSPHRTFLSMARTGLVATLLGVSVLAVGAGIALA